MTRLFVVFGSFIVFQTIFFQPAYANHLVSPYYRYFLPKRAQDEQPKVIETLQYNNERISLFTKDQSHQFGIKLETLQREAPKQTSCTAIQTIERRPFTARRSITDDGLMFQYWERYGLHSPYKVLFGYTTDKQVHQVQLKLSDGVIHLNLYNERYFICVLDPRERPVVAQGISKDGSVLRTWNGQFDYQPRRTWLSFFVQTYPYEVNDC